MFVTNYHVYISTEFQIHTYTYKYIYNVHPKTHVSFREQFTIYVVKKVLAKQMYCNFSTVSISCIMFNKTCNTCVKPADIQ